MSGSEELFFVGVMIANIDPRDPCVVKKTRKRSGKSSTPRFIPVYPRRPYPRDPMAIGYVKRREEPIMQDDVCSFCKKGNNEHEHYCIFMGVYQ